MLLAVLRLASGPDAIARAAELTGMPLAEARLKLTGVLPRALLVDADGERLAAIAVGLEAAGTRAIVLDPASAPADDERVIARGLEVAGTALTVIDGGGARHALPAAAIALVQRGTRVAVDRTTETTKSRELDLGKAMLTGGLIMSREVEKTSTRERETRQAFVLVHRGDGAPDVMLYEQRLDYRFLGAGMASSSTLNLERTFALVKAAVPGAAVDDRCARAAFVAALPAVGADPMDLALHLVRLAHLLGAA